MRYGIEVVWIDACGATAKVVQFRAFRDWTDEKFVDVAVCQNRLSGRVIASVAVPIETSSPYPASRRFDGHLLHPSRLVRAAVSLAQPHGRVAMPLRSPVVLLAEPSTLDLLVTSIN
jgi:hypothetical protein